MKITATPWGSPQQQNEIAPGIISVSTAGHGGIYLSPDRWRFVAALFPAFRPWAGDNWLEEDQDWALAAAAFPAEFDAQSVYHAVETIRHATKHTDNTPYFGRLGKWQDSAAGKRAAAIHAEFEAGILNKWHRGSMSTGGDGWRVHFTRKADGASRWEEMKDYPSQAYYTDEELAAVILQPVTA